LATLAAILAFILFTLFWFFYLGFGELKFISLDALLMMVANFQICLALLIVSVPEGMPLAISMALAFSFGKLTSDDVLVKKQEALETSGSLTSICTSKTSTLTKGDLDVAKFFVASTQLDVGNPKMNE
jgi:P-type E1-E2 ATPase